MGTQLSGAAAPDRKSRPGGRAAVVVAAVRAATLQLLDETGYDAMQLPDIAARAGVNKTTVYRRWPTKAALVSELLQTEMAVAVPARDTGTLLSDLVALLDDVVTAMAHPLAQAMLRVTLSGELDSTAAAARQTYWAERFRLSGAIAHRAIQRGELPASTDPRHLLELACSPLYFRAIVTGDPITPADIHRFATAAIAAVTRHQPTPT